MSGSWDKGGGAGGMGGLEDLLGALGGGQQGGGGLDGLLGQLRAGGLGPQLDSWIGTGGNEPVEAEDIHRAFGEQHLEALGDRMGMGGGALAAILAQALPMLIDRLSPQGQMPSSHAAPAGGGLGDILGSILGGGAGGGGGGGGGLGGALGGILGGLLGGGAQQQRGGPGEEVAPPRERGAPPARGGWPDQEAPAPVHPGKEGYPGKPGYAGKPGAAPYPGKPGWQPQPNTGGDGAGGSDDPLGDLARSADRLGRR